MTEDTVEVPARLLADLAYHFSVTTNMQTIPTAVVAPLADLAPDPDPDEELIKQVRSIAANPEMENSRIERIIATVRRNS